jgi:hypothetical protein
MLRIVAALALASLAEPAAAQSALAPPGGGVSCGEFAKMDAAGRLEALSAIEPLGGEVNDQDADAAQQWSDQVFAACGDDPERALDDAASAALGGDLARGRKKKPPEGGFPEFRGGCAGGVRQRSKRPAPASAAAPGPG